MENRCPDCGKGLPRGVPAWTRQLTVSEVMSRDPVTLGPEDSLATAAQGLDRAAFGLRHSPCLFAVLCQARLGKAVAAWEHLEQGLARGLLEEQTHRQPQPLDAKLQARQQKLSTQLEALREELLPLLALSRTDAAAQKRLADCLQQRQAVDQQLGELAAEVSRDLSSVYADQFGIDIAEWRVLATLGMHEPRSAQHIVRCTRTHKSKISRAVTRLALAGLVEGRHPIVPLYVNTSRDVLVQAKRREWFRALTDADVEIVTDTCTYLTPIMDVGRGPVMTDSGKWAWYAPGNVGVDVVIGGLEECVESAAAGRVVRDESLWAGG